MVPEVPTAKKMLFEKVTPRRFLLKIIPEVLGVHDIPSEDVRTVPEAPTAK